MFILSHSIAVILICRSQYLVYNVEGDSPGQQCRLTEIGLYLGKGIGVNYVLNEKIMDKRLESGYLSAAGLWLELTVQIGYVIAY